MQTLSAKIKQKAYELGFQKVGIASIEQLTEESVNLREWLRRGYHGTMDWMTRNIEMRLNPQNVLPDVKSIIVIGVNYYNARAHSQDKDVGKISRYAWGDDYHVVVKKRLQQLLDYICTIESTAVGKVYVDAGPVMEKVWAKRAGLGWMGKNTILITQDYGSWIFLGVIFLNVTLEYDTSVADYCGTCTLCIEACPTDAIVEPYVLDSTKCISYLTIEHRGDIPIELGKHFENWVYGCDICQEVCPWNEKFSTQTSVNEFYPSQSTVAPKLSELIAITEEEFQQKFQGTAIRRSTVGEIRRNAEIVVKSMSLVSKQF